MDKGGGGRLPPYAPRPPLTLPTVPPQSHVEPGPETANLAAKRGLLSLIASFLLASPTKSMTEAKLTAALVKAGLPMRKGKKGDAGSGDEEAGMGGALDNPAAVLEALVDEGMLHRKAASASEAQAGGEEEEGGGGGKRTFLIRLGTNFRAVVGAPGALHLMRKATRKPPVGLTESRLKAALGPAERRGMRYTVEE